MKVFVDDLREFPQGYECCRTYEQAILLLSFYRNRVELINLDYDLGTPKTGLDILAYMKENNINPKEIIIHSTHVEGVKQMEEYIRLYFPNSKYYRTYGG